MGHQTRQEQAWHVRLVIGCADKKDSWICVEIGGRRERCVGRARLVSWSYVAPGASVTSSASRRSSRSAASAASCVVPFRFSGFSPCYVHTSSIPRRVIICADPHAATPAFILQHLQVLSLYHLIVCTHSPPDRARVLLRSPVPLPSSAEVLPHSTRCVVRTTVQRSHLLLLLIWRCAQTLRPTVKPLPHSTGHAPSCATTVLSHSTGCVIAAPLSAHKVAVCI